MVIIAHNGDKNGHIGW